MITVDIEDGKLKVQGNPNNVAPDNYASLLKPNETNWIYFSVELTPDVQARLYDRLCAMLGRKSMLVGEEDN